MTKFCRDCRHFKIDTVMAKGNPGAYGKCANPATFGSTAQAEYLVAGTYPLEFACTIRRPSNKCGPDGALFETIPPKFENVSCSNCGGEFGPGNSGFSHCESHAHLDRIHT